MISKVYKSLIRPDEDPLEPLSDMVYPIVDYLDTVNLNTSAGSPAANSTVVGNLAQTFYWRDLMKNSLPIDSNGLIVVIGFTCSIAPFTYRIE
jgi:hypothetical protein